LQIHKDLCRALAAANNGDPVRRIPVGQQLWHSIGKLRRVDNAWVIAREHLRQITLAAKGDNDILRAVRFDSARSKIAGCDLESLSRTIGLDRGDRYNFGLVVHNIIEVTRAPAQVVLILSASRRKSIEINEIQQTVILVQVVEEREVRPRIAQRGQVLDERDLHLGARQQHAGVPIELGLLLEEEHVGLGGKLALLESVVQRAGDGDAGGTEADAEEVEHGVLGGRLQVGALGELAGGRLRGDAGG